MDEKGMVQHSPVRVLTPIDGDPIESDLAAQSLIVDWANMSYSSRTLADVFATQLGIPEVDLWHWVNRLKDRIRAVRAAKVEAEYGDKVDRAMATKAASGSDKAANVYYKYVESRKNAELEGGQAVQVNIGFPD